jgi:riboflavin synthase alpha subunit
MRMGDSIGGHKVLGHVDGMGKIIDMKYDHDGSCNVWVDISESVSFCYKIVLCYHIRLKY